LLSEKQTPTTCETPNRPAMIVSNSTKQIAIIFRPRCKLWSCPYCAAINRKLWTARAYFAAQQWAERGLPLNFTTLTSHEALTARQSWYVFPKAWKKLHARAKRKDGKAAYCMIPEQHEDGRIHVHMITTWSLGQGWWKTNARQCGLGYMDEEEPVVSPAKAAFYVSKYVGKQLGDVVWPRGFRRVRTSHKFPTLPPPAELPEWHFQVLPSGSLSEQATVIHFERLGYDVHLETSSGAWALIRISENDDTPGGE
jgi:hypothetical protein